MSLVAPGFKGLLVIINIERRLEIIVAISHNFISIRLSDHSFRFGTISRGVYNLNRFLVVELLLAKSHFLKSAGFNRRLRFFQLVNLENILDARILHGLLLILGVKVLIWVENNENTIITSTGPFDLTQLF